MHKGNEKQKEHLFYYAVFNIQVQLQPPSLCVVSTLNP